MTLYLHYHTATPKRRVVENVSRIHTDPLRPIGSGGLLFWAYDASGKLLAVALSSELASDPMVGA